MSDRYNHPVPVSSGDAGEEKTETVKINCCPPGSHGYLKQTGKPCGSTVEVNYYKVGKGTKALIIFSDVWGWNSGRVRLLADEFARRLNCVAVVPKLQKKFREGTDDDGLPPQFSIPDETDAFMKWVATNTWEKITPMVEGMMTQLRADGCTKFAAQGFCWGGWASFKFAEMYPGLTTCIGIAHPSCQLEGIFGGDVNTLAGKVACPVLLLPAGSPAPGDDPALYDDEDGSVMKALKSNPKSAKSKSVYFKEMQHGYMTRGDESDKTIEASVKKGLNMLVNWYTDNGFGANDEGEAPADADDDNQGLCCML